MSNNPKTERDKLLEVYHQLSQHLDHVILSSSVRAQLEAEKRKAIEKIKAIDNARSAV